MSAENVGRQEPLRKCHLSPDQRAKIVASIGRTELLALPGDARFMTEEEYAASRKGWMPYAGPAITYDANTWHKGALCSQTDPALFSPDVGQNTPLARRVCEACVVRALCLEDTLTREEATAGEPYGFAGGLSARARRSRLGQRSFTGK